MTVLKGKIALVTGASRGIGRAVALRLAELGARVAVNYLSRKKEAEETVTEIEKKGGIALAIHADVSLDKEAKEMVAYVGKEIGDITILVHNASPPFFLEALEDSAWESFQRHFEVSVRGGYNMMQAVLPMMQKAGYGKIITVLSALVLQGLPKKAASYVVAKEALWGLTKAGAADFAPYGIRINAVSPGLTDTEMAALAFPSFYKDMVAKKSPFGRITKPEDVADIIAFLASPASDHVTGLNIPLGIVT